MAISRVNSASGTSIAPSSAVLTRPSLPGCLIGCGPSRNTPPSAALRMVAHDAVAGVAGGVHALDGLARLLAGHQHRRRRGHALHAHREQPDQRQQADGEDQHRDEHLDEREAPLADPAPCGGRPRRRYWNHCVPLHFHVRSMPVTPKIVTARAVSGWFGHAHEHRAVGDVAGRIDERAVAGEHHRLRAGEGDRPRPAPKASGVSVMPAKVRNS